MMKIVASVAGKGATPTRQLITSSLMHNCHVLADGSRSPAFRSWRLLPPQLLNDGHELSIDLVHGV